MNDTLFEELLALRHKRPLTPEVGDPPARTGMQRRAEAPRGMAVDHRNAAVEVNRHHAEGRGFRLTASRQQNSGS